jgi:hypothetical protein
VENKRKLGSARYTIYLTDFFFLLLSESHVVFHKAFFLFFYTYNDIKVTQFV